MPISIAALLLLFLGRDVGLADNGDGARAMCGVGLGRSDGLRSLLAFDWHVADRRCAGPGRCGPTTARTQWCSSQLHLSRAL